jgi:cytochrome b
LTVEGGLWAIALAIYVKSTRARSWVGVVFFWLVAAMLTLTWYSNIAGPPPPNPHAAPISSLIFFTLIVLWAYWMNRARPASTAGDRAQTAGLGT